MTIRMKDLLVMNNFGVHSRLCGWMGGGNEAAGGDFICFNFSMSTLRTNQPPTDKLNSTPSYLRPNVCLGIRP